MRQSFRASAPVLTFLSPSSATSRRAAQRISQWTTCASSPQSPYKPLQPTTFSEFRVEWDAIALECKDTGTILQWISPGQSSSTKEEDDDNDRGSRSDVPHALVGLQEVANASDLSQARDCLFESFSRATKSAWKTTPLVMLSTFMGRSVKPKHLLGPQLLPVLDIMYDDSSTTNQPGGSDFSHSAGCLKEIVIPTYEDSIYHDDQQCLFEKLTTSPLLTRPATGLYMFPNGLVVRPLPAAKADRMLPPPTLIFHKTADEIDALAESIYGEAESEESASTNESTTRVISSGICSECYISKIGFTGNEKYLKNNRSASGGSRGEGVAKRGQIMVRHRDLLGLDVRFCTKCPGTYSSVFCEAQDSLLAGSLPQLQSTRVLQEGGNESKQQSADDPKTNKADCWIEVRSNLANPSGFLGGSISRTRASAGGRALPFLTGSNSKGVRVAKPPDIPFE